MFKSIYIFIVIYLIKTTYTQLTIKPNDSIISREQFKPFIALCTGEENTQILSWQSPLGINIEQNSNNRITTERKTYGLRLRIRNLTENDQGIWKCIGIDRNGKSLSNILQLNIKIPIKFLSESIQYAELNSNILIKCEVIANPSAEISWFKGYNKSEINSLNYEQKFNGLIIKQVSLIENDTFWCQADVIETGESKEYSIKLIISQSIKNTKITCLSPCAVEKRTAILVCEANGIPIPEYKWFYDQNHPLIVNGISKFVIRGNRLIINNVDETDNGRYICHAFNDYDKKGQRIEYILNIIIPPYLLPIPKIEINIDENISSQRVAFSCYLQRGSIANLSLQWFYSNNTLIEPINGISIVTSQVKTYHLIELIFNPIRREYHGNYTCLGKNLADVASTIAQLFLIYKPVLIEPKMINVYSAPNHHVIMKCLFDSSLPTIIQWIKLIEENDDNNNKILLDNNNIRVIKIFTKHIHSTIYETQLIYNTSEEDFDSKFQCQINNSYIEKHSIILRHAQPPRQVHISQIIPTSNSIQLKIQSQVEFDTIPLLRYIVKYEQINIPHSLNITSYPVLSNDSHLIEIKSLKAATLYRIQISVESPAGQSIFSNPVQATTLNGNIPQFILSNTSCLSHKSCLIKWFIETHGDTPISRGEISYAIIHSDGKIGEWKKPIQIDGKITEYKLQGLKSKTNYSIVVRLFNKGGYSEEKFVKTTDIISKCKNNCQRNANIWIIILIIISIIIGIIIIFILLVLNRILCNRIIYRKLEKNST